MQNETIKSLKKSWISSKKQIAQRLGEFKNLWETASEEEIFIELVFCLLTPQSKAKQCWDAANTLVDKKLLLKGSAAEISNELNRVRFKNNKARYIVLARKQFSINNKVSIKPLISSFKNTFEAREWLVNNVTGLGFKEASHFLRNIGFGENIAILDRHILKNLKLAGVINEIPKSLSRKVYFEIEDKMTKFAKNVKIKLSHLDLLMWCKETGEIFK